MIDVKKEGNRAIVKPGDALAGGEYAALKKGLLEAVEGGSEQISIDLEGVADLDAMGVAFLSAAHNSIKNKGSRLEVIHANEGVFGLLKTLGLDRHFDLTGANHP